LSGEKKAQSTPLYKNDWTGNSRQKEYGGEDSKMVLAKLEQGHK
jgi:hypothetical protein